MRRGGLAFLYFTAIALIVFLADRGDSQYLFAWIRAISGADKVGHFFLIGGFAFVVNYSLSCRTICFGTRPVLLGTCIVAVLTILEECSQLFIPYRTFDLLDLACDFLGICLLGGLARKIASKRTTAP